MMILCQEVECKVGKGKVIIRKIKVRNESEVPTRQLPSVKL